MVPSFQYVEFCALVQLLISIRLQLLVNVQKYDRLSIFLARLFKIHLVNVRNFEMTSLEWLDFWVQSRELLICSCHGCLKIR